jgi:hypothetical protein
MTQDFEKLIKNDIYQVFLMSCPASLPLSFARHPWLVINKKGEISRWGVGWKPSRYNPQKTWGHVACDALPAFQGLRVLYFFKKLRWPAKVHSVIEGEEGSLVQKMISVIEASPLNYPHKDFYNFTGPNSNTYVEWVILQFPESNFKLPWNAFGKHF